MSNSQISFLYCPLVATVLIGLKRKQKLKTKNQKTSSLKAVTCIHWSNKGLDKREKERERTLSPVISHASALSSGLVRPTLYYS